MQVLTELSEREREVFRLAADGLVNGQIACELCISRKTVETHKYRIQKKLGLRKPVDLLRFAAMNGMIRRPTVAPSHHAAL
jgi:two-component system response regulator NreC